MRLEDERCIEIVIEESDRADKDENIETEGDNNSAIQQYLRS